MPLLSIPNEHGDRPEAANQRELPEAQASSSLARTLARLGREHHRHNLRVRIADFGLLELHFDQCSYRTDFPVAELPRALSARRYVVTAIGTHVDTPAPHCSENPLTDLFWIAAQQLKDEALALPEDAPLKLAQWPNFPRLPHRVEHIQLCGMLSGHPMSLREMRAHSALSPASIATFLNAALAAGYVQRCSDDEALFAPKVVPMARGGLLQRLLNRIGF